MVPVLRRWIDCTVVAVAAALVAACSGGPPAVAPFAGTNVQMLHRGNAAPPAAGRSWMKSDASHKNLLYVSDLSKGEVHVYEYPGGRVEGTLKGFSGPFSVCTDTSGHVWILDANTSEIVEYEHAGTTPIATLDDAGYWPSDCAVNPKTGDLAVANVFTSAGQGTPGSLVVYKNARGNPKTFLDSTFFNYMYVSYDDQGNLFVDGFGNYSYNFTLAELRSGTGKLTDVLLNQVIDNGETADVQWNGKYVAIGDAGNNRIYQFAIRGGRGKKVGTTLLQGMTSGYLGHFLVPLIGSAPVASRVIVPNDTRLSYWNYPAGGHPTQTLATKFAFAYAAAVSQGK